MKISKIFSLFLFGLFVSGIVQAQEADVEMQVISEEPVMMEETMPMQKMMRGKMMEKMAGNHEECMGPHMERNEGMGCPMMKKMMSAHPGMPVHLFMLLHGLGMLIFLFFAAFVVRKGWEFKGFCCKKSCKK